jgi:hypothetical protein
MFEMDWELVRTATGLLQLAVGYRAKYLVEGLSDGRERVSCTRKHAFTSLASALQNGYLLWQIR